MSYGKAPYGLEFNIGYDYAGKAWIDNFVKYSNKDIGDFRLGQFKTPVRLGRGREYYSNDIPGARTGRYRRPI